ncbi:MAG TPA: cation-translocating P-type ATPase [Gemmatimonadales bacterium]|nr:cation-translocating P-type ATPase [Gemmatimonadales bacterium]
MGQPAVDATKSFAHTGWHAYSAEDTCRLLDVPFAVGLEPDEAARRLALHGSNAIVSARARGPLRMLLAQFTDFMVLLLLAAAILAAFLGEPQDIVAIIAIVVLNGVLGFVQEYRAERAMAALQALAAPIARVRRGGDTRTIPAADLVPGDVVWLEAGSLVPADLRLVEAARLKIEEAALTGESHAVEKSTTPLTAPDLPLSERRNMAYKGTMVTYGRGAGVVATTGMQTELGRIASLLRDEVEVRTPLQRRLTRLGQRLSVAVIVLCAVIFGIGLLRGEEPGLMFLTALSLAVAGIPEALPAVVTISLALGARKMLKQNALIRRLPAVETLGSVTYICSDKTGTLTQNRMQVEAFHVGDKLVREPPAADQEKPWSLLLAGLALNNDAVREVNGDAEGDPTEVALLLAAAHAGREKAELEARFPRLGEIPFSSERARMTTLHRLATGIVAFTKGAPERVLEGCFNRLTESGPASLDRLAILAATDEMARNGQRVLAIAYRSLPELPADLSPDEIEVDQTFLGLIGLLDPPRPEARESVALCKSAGIHVVMITGDHPATAGVIARTLGIARATDRIMTGQELARLSPEEFEHRITDIRVYARVEPEQKIKIVKALQDRGECVAMTGDGVNDAPALRRADIGVAMGRGGTDVAREAAHMVLLDDNFATIVGAVREGRRIYDNLRKFVKYSLTTGVGEIWPLFLAPLLGLPIPLLPIHILWINLVTDGLPGLTLAAERSEAGVMQRPPRPPRESLFAHGLWQHVVWVGLLMGSVTLGAQAWAYSTGSAHWQSITFTVMALSQMAHVLAIRSERVSLLRQGLWSNRSLLGAVVLTFALQMATLYLPALNAVFKTQPLTVPELVLSLLLSTLVFVAVEIEKAVRRRADRRSLSTAATGMDLGKEQR